MTGGEKMRKITVALDMGNSGGKVLAATMDGGSLEILSEKVIKNEFVEINGRLYWDLFYVFAELKKAMREFSELGDVICIGVDGTSGAYAFVNRNGGLGTYAASARDGHYAGWKTYIEEKISLYDLYRETGVYPLGGNVICKFACDIASGEIVPEMNTVFLQLSGLMEFMLTGRMTLERSMAGASVMMDRYFQEWNRPLLEKLGIPLHMLPKVEEPGDWGAQLLPSVARETNCPNCRFVHTVEFDSSTALISAPGFDGNQLYLSMGTTINPGAELDQPVISDLAWKYKYKNVPVWPGKYLLLSDVPGFFLLSECLKVWRKNDSSIGHGELISMAAQVKTDAFLNIYDSRLMMACDDMPERVQEFCRETGQTVPQTVGEIARVIFESYAVTIAWSLDRLKQITDKYDYSAVTAISGGSRNALLCQMISDASGMKVRAGDPQATCLGNLLVQFYAQGRLESLDDMRRESTGVCEMKEYLPKRNEHLDTGRAWLEAKGYLQ